MWNIPSFHRDVTAMRLGIVCLLVSETFARRDAVSNFSIHRYFFALFLFLCREHRREFDQNPVRQHEGNFSHLHEQQRYSNVPNVARLKPNYWLDLDLARWRQQVLNLPMLQQFASSLNPVPHTNPTRDVLVEHQALVRASLMPLLDE